MRLFIAIPLDSDLRRTLYKAAGDIDLAGAAPREVPPENMHVTMNFLGDVPDAEVRDVCQAVGRVARECEPFDIDFHSIRCMPDAGRKPRVIWVDVPDPSGALGQLYQELSAELDELGFPPERRPFNSHVTLLRFRYAKYADKIREAARVYEDVDFGTQRVVELEVVSSELTPKGPVYTPAWRAVLGA